MWWMPTELYAVSSSASSALLLRCRTWKPWCTRHGPPGKAGYPVQKHRYSWPWGTSPRRDWPLGHSKTVSPEQSFSRSEGSESQWGVVSKEWDGKRWSGDLWLAGRRAEESSGNSSASWTGFPSARSRLMHLLGFPIPCFNLLYSS